MKENKFSDGQSLIEIIFALVILSIILTGVVKIVVVSLKNAEFSRYQSVALNLAQTKMEQLRSDRDSSSWTAFKEKYINSSPLIESGLGLEGIFQRKTSFLAEGNDKVKIIIEVSWDDSRGTHISSISGYLTKWQ